MKRRSHDPDVHTSAAVAHVALDPVQDMSWLCRLLVSGDASRCGSGRERSYRSANRSRGIATRSNSRCGSGNGRSMSSHDKTCFWMRPRSLSGISSTSTRQREPMPDGTLWPQASSMKNRRMATRRCPRSRETASCRTMVSHVAGPIAGPGVVGTVGIFMVRDPD
jgi:hypothetical protein